jgi:acyl-CoA synthetase (AMP-forming)/AMP-acid ligase II
MLISDFLVRSAERLPDKVAVITDTRRLTYGEFYREAMCLAESLVRGGVRRGDRVLIWAENRAEIAVALYGTLLAGAAFVPINPTAKPRRVEFIIKDVEPVAAIVSNRAESWLSEFRRDPGSLRWAALVGGSPREDHYGGIEVTAFEDAVKPGPRVALPKVIDQDLGAVIYTSGTTKDPKGVVCPQVNMLAAATSVIEYLENVEDDVILNPLPLSFGYGLYQLLMSVQVGATVILEQSFAFPYAIAQQIERERVTGFPGVPTLFTMFLSVDLSGVDLSSVRYITNAGAAISAKTVQQIRDTFPKARFYSMYGTTECKRGSYLPPEELDRRPTSVGKAIPNSEVYLVDGEGNRIERAGEVGELVIRGANVMRGYWNRPEDTEKAFRPGPTIGERVLYTGDLFRMDEEGFLYFLSRSSDMLKSRGEKVSPREVESVIEDLSEVKECGVTGIPDPLLGDRIVALVVPRDGIPLTDKQVLRHCMKELESFMIPSEVLFCDSIPHTPNGKIRRNDLRELARSMIC